VEACAQDEELAARVAAGDVTVPASSGPRVSEWSSERAALADACDLLRLIFIAVLASGGAKTLPEFKPAPRPETKLATAVREAERTRESRRFLEFVSLLTPHALPRYTDRGGA
jgi:hypothetical protein